MRLITAHKVLIGAAVALALLLALRSGSLYRSTGSAAELLQGAGGLVLAVALGAYLRVLWRK